MNWCEICEIDFFTATEATTMRVREKDGRTVHLCDVCAHVEWDRQPIVTLKKEKERPVKTKKGKKAAGSR